MPMPAWSYNPKQSVKCEATSLYQGNQNYMYQII
jgi:hypothetical protein